MKINYRVYVKATHSSNWYFTGIIESDKEKAIEAWSEWIFKNKYYAYKLEYCTYGICYER